MRAARAQKDECGLWAAGLRWELDPSSEEELSCSFVASEAGRVEKSLILPFYQTGRIALTLLPVDHDAAIFSIAEHSNLTSQTMSAIIRHKDQIDRETPKCESPALPSVLPLRLPCDHTRKGAKIHAPSGESNDH
jgi:hypothetical protein